MLSPLVAKRFCRRAARACGVHVLDELRTTASEGEAEAVDGLVGLGGVDVDDLVGGGGGGEWNGRLEAKRTERSGLVSQRDVLRGGARSRPRE